MFVWPFTAWMAAGRTVSPCHFGVKSTRPAVSARGLRRNRWISFVVVTIHTSPSIASEAAVFGTSGVARYAVPFVNEIESGDSCFQSWPDAASRT